MTRTHDARSARPHFAVAAAVAVSLAAVAAPAAHAEDFTDLGTYGDWAAEYYDGGCDIYTYTEQPDVTYAFQVYDNGDIEMTLYSQGWNLPANFATDIVFEVAGQGQASVAMKGDGDYLYTVVEGDRDGLGPLLVQANDVVITFPTGEALSMPVGGFQPAFMSLLQCAQDYMNLQ